jgi:arylsulfatase A-like enzyme
MESHTEARLQPSNVTGPTFLYLHFLDAHFPYGHGPGRPFDRYLASLALVDTQVGKLRAALESNGLWQRTIFIVYADHGEAFGEHGLEWHGASLYDELMRVPLLVRIPGRDPAVVHDPVSLIDLGPTILDLMGVATPGNQMGQSLVPLLRGEHPALDRPLVAEARLKRSLVLSDGIKIIDDARPRGVEMYDLTADPGETKNLYDEANPDAKRRYDILRTFFDVQTLKRPGYEVPYRQW